MSWPDMMTPWAPAPAPVTARPDRCTCTRPVVATLAETLGCPRRWLPVPGGGWAHAPGWAR